MSFSAVLGNGDPFTDAESSSARNAFLLAAYSSHEAAFSGVSSTEDPVSGPCHGSSASATFASLDGSDVG
jgi:hypothetical protein